MQESFLHFLWRFQYFDKTHLLTTDGAALQILTPGLYNTDAGPDFQHTRLLLNGVEWVGQTELHLRSSDWVQHNHGTDYAYNNVILHVVWQNDRTVFRPDGTVIPTLELASRTDLQLLSRYKALTENRDSIPCANRFAEVPEIYHRQALDIALMQRLAEKAGLINSLWQQNGQDWEETAYQALARNMGFKVNSEPFLRLAQNLPLKILRKHGQSLFQLEALLLGQAGFLEQSFTEEYPVSLQNEYRFLARKYRLAESQLSKSEWKFMRLRPANFPTLRLAQFAALLHRQPHLFSLFTQENSSVLIPEAFELVLSPYWRNHFSFGKTTQQTGNFGASSIHNIIINTAVPLLVSYDQHRGEAQYTTRAIRMLESLPAEDNKIIRDWKSLRLSVSNAFDSQAGIELFNRLCSLRKCLSCPVGNFLLRKG